MEEPDKRMNDLPKCDVKQPKMDKKQPTRN